MSAWASIDDAGRAEVVGMPVMRAAVCVLLSMALTACGGGGEATPDTSGSAEAASQSNTTTTQSADALVDCSTSIFNGEQLPEDYATVLDSVALPTADSASRALQVGHHPTESAPSYYAKTGLLIQPGTSFSIEVNHAPDTAALTGWGSTGGQPITGISSSGCEGEAWIVFAGGIVVREPMCVELTVKVNDAQEVISVGAGAPCEGQQAPPSTP